MDDAPDDDHFHGHPRERLLLESRVQQFNASEWINRRGTWGVGVPTRRPLCAMETAKFHNPYAGVAYAWQLTETLPEFLSRLPPATTDQSEDVPWIFICNPFVAREDKTTVVDAHMKGNEDEAPPEAGRQLSFVVEGAKERLTLLSELMQRVKTSGKAGAFIARELSQERRHAASDILHLAHAGRVRTGKASTMVNELWELVARATANNELGIAAKVAPRSIMGDSTRDRLICIYTSDFMDKADVARVLRRMRELKIAGTSRRKIYYKPDIFTYAGIAGGNPWELAASIYNSNEF
ncbi:hypothetical protein E4U13_001282 [Claviceps humidiphila]|uniref:DUF1917-domain-containing protein n=1 Tax=Claviceps humidiphila TaxID=1294629 RepID=A0A9P7Q2J0_9HYPO|nr:hypothetical protein E4U13_001282 [Claviceps humidiphila]